MMTRSEPSETVGKLCVGGDWACAHGDFSGLRDIARRLESFVVGTLHDELADLEGACLRDPERAAVLWCRARAALRSPVTART